MKMKLPSTELEKGFKQKPVLRKGRIKIQAKCHVGHWCTELLSRDTVRLEEYFQNCHLNFQTIRQFEIFNVLVWMEREETVCPGVFLFSKSF